MPQVRALSYTDAKERCVSVLPLQNDFLGCEIPYQLEQL
jgi:hypothetical protein